MFHPRIILCALKGVLVVRELPNVLDCDPCWPEKVLHLHDLVPRSRAVSGTSVKLRRLKVRYLSLEGLTAGLLVASTRSSLYEVRILEKRTVVQFDDRKCGDLASRRRAEVQMYQISWVPSSDLLSSRHRCFLALRKP